MSKIARHIEKYKIKPPHLRDDIDLDYQYELFLNEQYYKEDYVQAYYDQMSFQDRVDRINYTKNNG